MKKIRRGLVWGGMSGALSFIAWECKAEVGCVFAQVYCIPPLSKFNVEKWNSTGFHTSDELDVSSRANYGFFHLLFDMQKGEAHEIRRQSHSPFPTDIRRSLFRRIWSNFAGLWTLSYVSVARRYFREKFLIFPDICFQDSTRFFHDSFFQSFFYRPVFQAVFARHFFKMAQFNLAIEASVSVFDKRIAPGWSARTVRDLAGFNVTEEGVPLVGLHGLRTDVMVCWCFKTLLLLIRVFSFFILYPYILGKQKASKTKGNFEKVKIRWSLGRLWKRAWLEWEPLQKPKKLAVWHFLPTHFFLQFSKNEAPWFNERKFAIQIFKAFLSNRVDSHLAVWY